MCLTFFEMSKCSKYKQRLGEYPLCNMLFVVTFMQTLIHTLSVYGVEAERRRWTDDHCTSGRHAKRKGHPKVRQKGHNSTSVTF